MQPGLTMIVGPPGTGKTDVAVQIISNIYHNFPEQRTCIVTHSNQERFGNIILGSEIHGPLGPRSELVPDSGNIQVTQHDMIVKSVKGFESAV